MPCSTCTGNAASLPLRPGNNSADLVQTHIGALDFRASELCSDAASRSSDGQRAMLAAQLKDFEAPQIGKYSELCLQHVPAEGPRIASSSVEWFG